MHLQLRHLRNLSAVAEAGSLNRAAADLGLPQPALSRQVRRLEALLGGALFRRGVDGVQLTPLGEQVLEHADTILRLFDELGVRFRAHQRDQQGTLRVGWDASPLSDLLLSTLWELRADGHLQVVAVDSIQELAERLRLGEIDIALCSTCSRSRLPDVEGVVAQGLADTRAQLALSSTHPLAANPVIAMSDLADQRWISSSGPDACQEELRGLCAEYGFLPDIAYDVPVGGPRGDVLRHQDCVTLVQPLRITGPGVLLREVVDLELLVRHSLVFRPGPQVTPLVPGLVRLLRTAYQSALRDATVRGRPSDRLR